MIARLVDRRLTGIIINDHTAPLSISFFSKPTAWVLRASCRSGDGESARRNVVRRSTGCNL
jgi:hypothetical protein